MVEDDIGQGGIAAAGVRYASAVDIDRIGGKDEVSQGGAAAGILHAGATAGARAAIFGFGISAGDGKAIQDGGAVRAIAGDHVVGVSARVGSLDRMLLLSLSFRSPLRMVMWVV